MKLKPMFDRVVVKRDTVQSTTSKIIIPEQIDKQNAPARGVVLAVGPTAGWRDKDGTLYPVTVGSRILFGKHAGTTVQEDGETLWVLQDTDLLCEITE